MMKYIHRNYVYVIWNGVRYLGRFRKINNRWMFHPAYMMTYYDYELEELSRDLRTLNAVGEI